jgi:uncharacterized membrane protein
VSRSAEHVRAAEARPWTILVWAAAALYAVLISAESLYDDATFRAGFDSAIYDQRLWLLSNFDNPFSTVVSRPFLADHFEPGLVLLTPLYWLGLDMSGVYVAQAIGLALVAPALYALARESGASPSLAGLPAILWLVSPPVAAANLFDFRPASFVPLFLVLSVLFAIQRRYVLLGLATVLALSLKEDVALIYVVFGLILVFQGSRKVGSIMAVGSFACFVLGVTTIRLLGDQYEWQGERFAGDRGDSFLEAVGWIVRHPLETIGDVVTQSGADLVVLLVSTGGLAVLAPIWILLAAPTALVNALSAYDPQHDLLNHYHLSVLAALFVAAAIGAGRAHELGRIGRAAIAVCVALVVPIALVGGVLTHDLSGRLTTSEREEIERALDLIPPGAPVAAAPNALPRLSHRVEVYSLPEPFIPIDWGSSLSAEEFAERAERVRFAVFIGRTKPREYPGSMAVVWDRLRGRGFEPVVRGSHVQILELR